MTGTPTRWMSLEERDGRAPADDPAPESGEVSRRAFLAAAGFGVAAVSLAGCGRPPTSETAPTLDVSEEVVPGRSLWYSTTCAGCPAGCGLRVKCRDGRPIKVEGNPDHPISRGGVCAVGQAGVIGLYDSRRPRLPVMGGRPISWEEADGVVARALAAAREAGKSVRLLTGTVTSPSTMAFIARFLAAHPGARHVAYDPLTASAALDAHLRTHGARVLPRVRLERAREILAIDADFLGTWISPVEHTRGFVAGRTLEGSPPRLSNLVVVESALTLTGSNADRRIRLAPEAIGPFVAHLARALSEGAGGPGVPSPEGPSPVSSEILDGLAGSLLGARGEAVVLCGTNDLAVQTLVNHANHLLGAYGTVLDLEAPSFQRRGDDAALAGLVEEVEGGSVGALFVAGGNPVADSPFGTRLAAALSRGTWGAALAEREDETTALLPLFLPAPHPLESWDDAESVAGVVSLSQPAISPLGSPRTLRENLAAWTGRPARDLDLVREAWREIHQPRLVRPEEEARAWRNAVQTGFALVTPAPSPTRAFDPAALAGATPRAATPAAGRLSLVLHPVVAMLDGRHAQNPWLQELPDPITKQCWGNAACLSPATAEALGVEDGQVVRVSDGDAAAEAPVIVVPGQADGTVALALGYGRRGTDRFAGIGPGWLESRATVAEGGVVGAAAGALLEYRDRAVRTAGRAVSVERAGRTELLARSQTYPFRDLPARTAPRGKERRDAVRETTISAFAVDPAAGNHPPHAMESLWTDDHPATGPRWGMVVDLTACTGCSACVVACQAENNIPVVGKDEVARRRDMAWIRVDRYFSDRPGEPGGVDVVHQPMLCQHCGHAPCETVCPVLATVHSADGLNAQVYNRCIGTRYCANNCPYKVRRFNWFDYPREDPLQDLVLNPDVTVRSRGVMEKCSFCVQRIHEAKAEAKRRGAALSSMELRTACEQSCPAGAIVFGDLSDPESAVSRRGREPRSYRVLEELNLRPSVAYLTKVRRREGELPEERHG